MELDFNSKFKETDIYEKKYNYLLQITLKMLKIKCDPIVSVTIGDNKSIHQINKKYRHIDQETDVISFAFLDEDKNGYSALRKKQQLVLGDIYISYEKAKTQAKQIGNTLEREMCFLFIHGLLHLLGFDHIKKEDEKRMFTLQEKILGEAKDGLSKII